MNDNVIKFPFKKETDSKPDIFSEEDAVIETLWVDVLEGLRKAGHDFSKDTDKYFPSMVLIFEAMRSLSMLEKGKEHPLQDLSNEFFGYQDFKFDEEERDLYGEMTLDEMFNSIEDPSK